MKKISILFFFFMFVFASGQNTSAPVPTYYKCYMSDKTVIDSVRLDHRERSTLIVNYKDSLQQIPLEKIIKMGKYIEAKDSGNRWLGVAIGATLGAVIGWGIAPKGEAFNDTFAPDGKYYITGGALIGGAAGYFITAPGGEEYYQLKGIEWQERLSLIDSLIEKIN